MNKMLLGAPVWSGIVLGWFHQKRWFWSKNKHFVKRHMSRKNWCWYFSFYDTSNWKKRNLKKGFWWQKNIYLRISNYQTGREQHSPRDLNWMSLAFFLLHAVLHLLLRIASSFLTIATHTLFILYMHIRCVRCINRFDFQQVGISLGHHQRDNTWFSP